MSPGGTEENSPGRKSWEPKEKTIAQSRQGRQNHIFMEIAMAHSFISSLFHCVFSTKDRRKIINAELQERLWPYLGGIARSNDMKALAVGGVEDHVHLLLSLPSMLAPAKAMQLIKANSTKWIHETYRDQAAFCWQEGYGAFSIGKSQVDPTIVYIRTQAEHHRKNSFQEEFLAFLKKHEIDYDPRYVWG